jgi:hypothetical protein
VLRTETAVVAAAARFFGSASTLLGVSPVSSLTWLETLLLSSVFLLRQREGQCQTRDGVRGMRCWQRRAPVPMIQLLALALECGVPANEDAVSTRFMQAWDAHAHATHQWFLMELSVLKRREKRVAGISGARKKQRSDKRRARTCPAASAR